MFKPEPMHVSEGPQRFDVFTSGDGPVPHRVQAFIDHMTHQLAGMPSLRGRAGPTPG